MISEVNATKLLGEHNTSILLASIFCPVHYPQVHCPEKQELQELKRLILNFPVKALTKSA